jgi:predicted DNA-binding transcriptional regulator AlpA
MPSPHLGVAIARDLPKILFVEQLSALIGKTPTTIRTCATNAKYQHLIPRPFKLPHSRRLCWYETDVLDWINSHRPTISSQPRRARGRPTKAEQLARQQYERSAVEASTAADMKSDERRRVGRFHSSNQ